MKLVELLAKELSEWPEGAKNITQDRDGGLSPCTDPLGDLEFDGSHWTSTDGFHIGIAIIESRELSSDYKTAIVTRAQWQAERDRQKGGEWKRHRGGKCPVKAGTEVTTKHRDGKVVDVHHHTAQSNTSTASLNAVWKHNGDSFDIMHYKVISQPQAEEVEVKDTTIGTLSYKVEIDTSPAMKALNELSAKWDQVESPFKWRDEVTELNAYIEEFTREREALINRLAEEGFALLPAMHPVAGVTDIIIPIEEWAIGDIVEVISVSDYSEAPLGVFKITDIDSSEPKYELDDSYFPKHEQMKFVRRP